MFRACHTRGVWKRTLLLLLATAVVVDARMPPAIGVRQPIILQLTGHFTDDREAARAQGTDAISVLVNDRERWFAVDVARTVGGDPTLNGRDVLAILAPMHPTLRAVGDSALRGRLADSAPGAKIRLEGLVDRGSHTYLLRSVASAVPPEAPAQ